jgi:hypothetical protein
MLQWTDSYFLQDVAKVVAIAALTMSASYRMYSSTGNHKRKSLIFDLSGKVVTTSLVAAGTASVLNATSFDDVTRMFFLQSFIVSAINVVRANSYVMTTLYLINL